MYAYIRVLRVKLTRDTKGIDDYGSVLEHELDVIVTWSPATQRKGEREREEHTLSLKELKPTFFLKIKKKKKQPDFASRCNTDFERTQKMYYACVL